MRDFKEIRNFNDFMNEEFFKPFEPFMHEMRRHSFPPVFDMRTDIIDNGDNIVYEMEIPGVNKEDISIEMEKGVLTISIEKKSQEQESDKNYIVRERHYGNLVRRFGVEGITDENISAKYENGILFVTIKKPEEKKSSKIQIQ